MHAALKAARLNSAGYALLRATVLAGCLVLAACGAPAWKPPVPVEQVGFLDRAVTQSRAGLEVTVAIPDREETTLLFGTSLYDDRIQPVWIRVVNQSGRRYVLLREGLDSDAFSPLEAAYQRHSGSKDKRLAMDRFFYDQAFRSPIETGEVASGFVFANLDEGAKAVNIDLVTEGRIEAFSFVIDVPGLVTDISLLNLDDLYTELIDIEDPAVLRKTLEELPCCTTNKSGDRNGDPLNLVFIGDRRYIYSALIRQGWHLTEVTYGASAWKTVKSFMFGSRYRYSPISPLYVFGRQQDIGLQKARDSIHLRNHMRIWRTPYLFQGKEVYLGQISRDIGVKFNKRTITTHAIDPDVDDTRDGLIGDLAYSQVLTDFGYVAGAQEATIEDPSYNLTPDPYFSDGYRAVLVFDERITALDEVQFFEWEWPDRRR